jgi:hypothetical protein
MFCLLHQQYLQLVRRSLWYIKITFLSGSESRVAVSRGVALGAKIARLVFPFCRDFRKLLVSPLVPTCHCYGARQ